MCLSRMENAIVDEMELTIGSKMVNIHVVGKHSAQVLQHCVVN